MKNILYAGLILLGMTILGVLFIFVTLLLPVFGISYLASNYSDWFWLLVFPLAYLFSVLLYYVGTRYGDMPKL